MTTKTRPIENRVAKSLYYFTLFFRTWRNQSRCREQLHTQRRHDSIVCGDRKAFKWSKWIGSARRRARASEKERLFVHSKCAPTRSEKSERLEETKRETSFDFAGSLRFLTFSCRPLFRSFFFFFISLALLTFYFVHNNLVCCANTSSHKAINDRTRNAIVRILYVQIRIIIIMYASMRWRRHCYIAIIVTVAAVLLLRGEDVNLFGFEHECILALMRRILGHFSSVLSVVIRCVVIRIAAVSRFSFANPVFHIHFCCCCFRRFAFCFIFFAPFAISSTFRIIICVDCTRTFVVLDDWCTIKWQRETLKSNRSCAFNATTSLSSVSSLFFTSCILFFIRFNFIYRSFCCMKFKWNWRE